MRNLKLLTLCALAVQACDTEPPLEARQLPELREIDGAAADAGLTTAGHEPAPTAEECREALELFGADCTVSDEEYEHGHIPRAVRCRRIDAQAALRYWGGCAPTDATLESVLERCERHTLLAACQAAVSLAAALAEMPAQAGCTVSEVIDMGCHNDRVSSGDSTVPSQHTFATACDIAGFECDGRYYLVRDDWDAVPMRVLKEALERHFAVVLHPDNEPSHHYNHFHASDPLGAELRDRPMCGLGVALPESGAVLQQGTEYSVCWGYNGECRDYVRVHLYLDGAFYLTLAADEPIDRGCIPFEPTADMEPSDRYQIGVSNDTAWAFSGFITIEEAEEPPPPPPPAPRCGDGECNGSETCSTCPADCGACPPPPPRCGDGDCNGTETCQTCSTDCGPCCGNGSCGSGESCSTCPIDCGACPPPPPRCGDGNCNGSESCSSCSGDCGTCPPRCGDDDCNGTETCRTCPDDCGPCCGNGSCGGSETCSTCPADCGACPPPAPWCGDRECNGSETCSTCPADCGTCPPPPPRCGDGDCNGTETCQTCSTDCGPCCGNGICDGDEACEWCPEDCGECAPPDDTREGRVLHIHCTNSVSPVYRVQVDGCLSDRHGDEVECRDGWDQAFHTTSVVADIPFYRCQSFSGVLHLEHGDREWDDCDAVCTAVWGDSDGIELEVETHSCDGGCGFCIAASCDNDADCE